MARRGRLTFFFLAQLTNHGTKLGLGKVRPPTLCPKIVHGVATKHARRCPCCVWADRTSAQGSLGLLFQLNHCEYICVILLGIRGGLEPERPFVPHIHLV